MNGLLITRVLIVCYIYFYYLLLCSTVLGRVSAHLITLHCYLNKQHLSFQTMLYCVQ